LPARVQVRLGSARLEVDEVDAAIAAFQLAKRKSSRDWRAYAGLGEAYLRQRDRDKARLELEEAVRLNPNAVSAIESLATLLVDAEDWTGARRAIDQGLKVQSTNGRLQILDGVVLMNTGEPDKAIHALERGTARQPKDVQAWLLLGILHQQAGRHSEAIDCYRQVHEIDEELATAHLNEGLCLFALERYDEAAKKLTRAIELENSNTFALLSYGILAMEYLGRDEDALAAFLRYKRNGGEDPRVDAWIKRLGG